MISSIRESQLFLQKFIMDVQFWATAVSMQKKLKQTLSILLYVYMEKRLTSRSDINRMVLNHMEINVTDQHSTKF